MFEVEVAYPQIAHLAFTDQLVERLKSIGQVHTHGRPMDEVKIQVIQPQPLQTGFAAFQHIGIAQVAHPHLGGNQ
ncbi:hypothetical protein SDC9_132263 [bioreactor metagenome]|uniref:Uncharacterized protein n=1 Tax=bioreactor metagenome TaxID=1076179 RepID=A0A645D7J9_9ZZZZ